MYLSSLQCVLRAFGIKQLSDFECQRYWEPREKKSSHLEAFSADLNDMKSDSVTEINNIYVSSFEMLMKDKEKV